MWRKGTEKGQGETSKANQIAVGGGVPLPKFSLSEGVAPLRSSLPWPAWLAAQEVLDQLVAGSLERGSDERGDPHSRWWDVLLDKLLLTYWLLFPLYYLLRPVSSGQPKPPHIFHLAPSGCPNSQALLSNKGTWNHRNWVRPSRQISQASENSLQVLGSQRALCLLSSYLDMVAHSSGVL